MGQLSGFDQAVVWRTRQAPNPCPPQFADFDAKFRRWWLVIKDGEVDVCMKDAGHETDLTISTDVRTLTGVQMGDIGLGQALRDRRIRLTGPTRLSRDITTWLGRNYFADIPTAR